MARPTAQDREDAKRRKEAQQATIAALCAPKTNSDGSAMAIDHLLKLLLSIDYGTKTLKISARFVPRDSEASDSSHEFVIYDVVFAHGSGEAEQIVAFSKDCTEFLWGREVEDALSDNEIDAEDAIPLTKLLLYNDYGTSDTVKQLRSQLDQLDITVDDVLAVHLGVAIKYARTNLKNGRAGLKHSNIDTMPVEVLLAVPQLWKPPACIKMVRAAKKAGAAQVELVREQECATAYYTNNIKDMALAEGHQIGDRVIVGDTGGGTTDVMSVEYVQDVVHGAKVGLKHTGDAAGELCGSEMVNDEFRTWAKEEAAEHHGSFWNLCELLGMSTTACFKEASDQFEQAKRTFSVRNRKTKYVAIHGAPGAELPGFELVITSDRMRSFFDPVIAKIKACIDAQISPETKCILIFGGFGNSDYLRSVLEAYYEARGLKVSGASLEQGWQSATSRGALLRYDDIKARGFDAQASFGLARVENFDPNVHRDASVANGVVMHDPYYSKGHQIVYERFLPISRLTNANVPGQGFENLLWGQSVINAGQLYLPIQVYWTELILQEHAPIRSGATPEDPLLPGIEEWGPAIQFKMPYLKALGFKGVRGDGNYKGWVYDIRWRLRLFGEGANINVELVIARPGTAVYDDTEGLGTLRMNLGEDEVIRVSEQIFPLSEEAFNPTPRSEF